MDDSAGMVRPMISNQPKGMLVALCSERPSAFYDLTRCCIAWGRADKDGQVSFIHAHRDGLAAFLVVPDLKLRKFAAVSTFIQPVAVSIGAMMKCRLGLGFAGRA